MKEHVVNNFGDLHEVLSQYRKDNRWLFRGHGDPGWVLTPKVGRDEFVGCDERRIFQAWKRRAAEFISLPFDDDWGWLAVAQHHGLATRLLDWTFNPLAAAFFAVETPKECDAVVFAYRRRNIVDPEEISPFAIREVMTFRPKGVAPRIIRQGGIFTVHNKPERPLETMLKDPNALEKIVVRSSYRQELLFELSHYGINRATLFPDLDGLSAYMNWATINRRYWAVPIDREADEAGS
jgi:FRG domain-containing protein